MAKINFTNLTAPNGALQDLRELIFLKLLENKNLNEICRIIPDQENGKKVGLLRGFGMLGKADQGCNPTYSNSVASTSEQTWEIKEWEIAEKVCYTELAGTLAERARRKGVDIANLTGTFYIDNILYPMLDEAIKEMLLRFAFFGDKNASVYNADTNPTGTLKSGMDADHFKLIDGFWTRIFAAVTAGTISRTTIAANSQSSKANQKSAFTTSGVATSLFLNVMEDASFELQEAQNQLFLISKRTWNAWKNDVRNKNNGSEGQWETWFNGITVGEIEGVRTIVLPFWDKMIDTALQNVTNVNAWEMPYRVIYTTADNLLVGTSDSGALQSIDYWFERKEKENYIDAMGSIGTMILDHNLCHVAY